MEGYTGSGWDCSRGRARAVAVIRVLLEPYTTALEIDDDFAEGAGFDERVSRAMSVIEVPPGCSTT